MKNGSILFALVLLIALAIPLFADHALVNPVSEFSTISINLEEEVVVESALYMTVDYEILAIKPVGIKQSWLPSKAISKQGNFTNTIKCKIPSVNMKANIQRRIRSPV